MTSSAGASPELDVSIQIPELKPFLDAARAGDRDRLRQLFTSDLPADLATAVSDAVAALPGVVDVLEDLHRQDPSSLPARVLLAATHIHLAWEARSSARAEDVSEQQFADFATHLRRAESHLIEVCALERDNATAWSLRQLTALGLGLGVGESRRRHDHAADAAPDLYPSRRTHLQTLCPKWYGSWEQASAYVTELTTAARPGDISPALLADLHLEQIVDLPVAQRGKHLTTQVVDELRAAADASLFHPDLPTSAHTVQAHTTFAAMYSYGGQHSEAVRHFRALGDFSAERPWNYFGEPATEYRQHRSAAEKVAR